MKHNSYRLYCHFSSHFKVTINVPFGMQLLYITSKIKILYFFFITFCRWSVTDIGFWRSNAWVWVYMYIYIYMKGFQLLIWPLLFPFHVFLQLSSQHDIFHMKPISFKVLHSLYSSYSLHFYPVICHILYFPE